MTHNMWRLVSTLYAHRVGVLENENVVKSDCPQKENDDHRSLELKANRTINNSLISVNSAKKHNTEKEQRETHEQEWHSPLQHQQENEELQEQIINSEMYAIARDVVEYYSTDDKLSYFDEINNIIERLLLLEAKQNSSCKHTNIEYTVLDLASMISTCTAIVCKLMETDEHVDKIEKWHMILFQLVTMNNNNINSDEVYKVTKQMGKCITFVECVCYHLATLIFTHTQMRSTLGIDNNILQHSIQHFMEVIYTSQQEKQELEHEEVFNKELIILELFTQLTHLFINHSDTSCNKSRSKNDSNCPYNTKNINVLIEASLQIMEKSVIENNEKSKHTNSKVIDGKDENVSLITALAKCVLMPLFNAINQNDEIIGKSEVPTALWQTRLHKILRSLVPHSWLVPVYECEEKEQQQEETQEHYQRSFQSNELPEPEYKEHSEITVDDSISESTSKHIVSKSGDDFIILVAALFDVLFTPQPSLTNDNKNNFSEKELSVTSPEDIAALNIESAQLDYRYCDYLWQILLHSLRQSILYNTNGEGDMNGAHWNTIQLRVVYLLKRIVDNTTCLTENNVDYKCKLHISQAKCGKGKLRNTSKETEHTGNRKKANTKNKKNCVGDEHNHVSSNCSGTTGGILEYHVYHKYFVWLQGKSEKAWETFFLIFETLNEYGWHMIEPIMPAFDSLLTEYVDDIHSDQAENVHKCKTKVQITSINIVWLELLFLKMLHHNNLAIRKVALRRLWALPNEIIAAFSLQFICGDALRAATLAKMCTDLDRAPLLTFLTTTTNTTSTSISPKQIIPSESNQTKIPSNSATFFESNPFEGEEVNATPFIEPIIDSLESFYVRVFTHTLHSAKERVCAFRLLLAATLPSPSRFTLTCLLRIMCTLTKELYKEAIMHSEACTWTWAMIMDTKVQHTIEFLLRDALQDNIPFWLDVRCTGIMFTTLIYFHAIDFLYSDTISSRASLSLKEHKEQNYVHKYVNTSEHEQEQQEETCVGMCTRKRNESLWKLLCLCGPLGQAGVKSNLQLDGCAYIGNVGGAVDVAFLNVQLNKVSEEIDMLSLLHFHERKENKGITRTTGNNNIRSYDNHNTNSVSGKESQVGGSKLISFRDRLLQVDTLRLRTRQLLEEKQNWETFYQVDLKTVSKEQSTNQELNEELELQESCDDMERCCNNSVRNDCNAFKEHFFLIGSLLLPLQCSNQRSEKRLNCNNNSSINITSTIPKLEEDLNFNIDKMLRNNASMQEHGQFTSCSAHNVQTQEFHCYSKESTNLIRCICSDVMTCALNFQNRPYCNQHKLLNALSAFVELHFALFSEVRACNASVAVHAETFYSIDQLNALMSFLRTYSLNALRECWNNIHEECISMTSATIEAMKNEYELPTIVSRKHSSKYKTEVEEKDEEEMWSLQQTEQWDVLTATVNAVIHIASLINKSNDKHHVITELTLLPFMQELVTLLHEICTNSSKTNVNVTADSTSTTTYDSNSVVCKNKKNNISSSNSVYATRIIKLARNTSRLLQCVFNGLIVQKEQTNIVQPRLSENKYEFTQEYTNMSSMTSHDAIVMIEKLMECTFVRGATSHNASTTRNALLLAQLVRGVYTSIYSLCQFVCYPSNEEVCKYHKEELLYLEKKNEMEKTKVEELLSHLQEFALEEIEKCWSVNLPTVYVLLCWILSKLPIRENKHNVYVENDVCISSEEEYEYEEEHHSKDNNNDSQSTRKHIINTEAIINAMLAHLDDVSSLQHTRLLTWMHIGLQYASRTSPDFVMHKLTQMINITSLKPSSSSQEKQKLVKNNKKLSMKAAEVLENDRELYFVSLSASIMLLSNPEQEQWERMRDFMLELCVLCQCNHMEDEGETTLSTTEPMMQEWGDNFNEYYLPTVRLSSVGRALLLSTLLKCASMHPTWAMELTCGLIEMNLTHSLVTKSPCMPNSRAHRARIRIWQLLCALLPLLPYNEEQNIIEHDITISTNTTVYDIFKRVVWECLPIINTGSVRRFMELYVIELLRRHPSWFTIIDEALSNYNLRAQVCGSYILISAHAILNCMRESYTHTSLASSSEEQEEHELLLLKDGEPEKEKQDVCTAMSNALLPRLFQQATSHQHLLRTISHVSLCKIAELRRKYSNNNNYRKIKSEKSDTVDDNSECAVTNEQHEEKSKLSGAEKQVDALFEFIRDADEHTKFRIRHEAVLFYDTSLALQPRHLFCYQRYEANNVLHDSIPAASFERLALLSNELQSVNALRLPFEWMVLWEHLANLQFNSLLNSFVNFAHIPHTVFRTRHHVDYSPESVRMLRTDTSTTCNSTSLPSAFQSAHENNTAQDEESDDVCNSFKEENTLNVQRKVSAWWCSEVYNELHPRALHQQRQELVIVASLLENPVNVAGLFRCADIFAVSEIVIDDKRVLTHPHFIAAARSAELWVPWRSIAPRHLPNYFVQMKALGYTVIGLEQTARSVAIDHFRFSAKTVLVLGAEGQGIAASLLPYCDRCVEITQFGLIRSLNVHVTGAIAMYEYTKQHLMSKSIIN